MPKTYTVRNPHKVTVEYPKCHTQNNHFCPLIVWTDNWDDAYTTACAFRDRYSESATYTKPLVTLTDPDGGAEVIL